MASLVSSWKSQGHPAFTCPSVCSTFSDLAFFQDSSETGTTHPSCSAGWKTWHHLCTTLLSRPLPSHVNSSFQIPEFSLCHLLVQATPCLSPVLLQTATNWPSHFYFQATNLHSVHCSLSSVENSKQLDDIILH